MKTQPSRAKQRTANVSHLSLIVCLIAFLHSSTCFHLLPTMSSTRLHPHHSLPAPVVHAAFSVSQSKSHVLAGVQDAYWSDDEAVRLTLFFPLCLSSSCLATAGGRGMPSVSRGDGHFRSQLQTLYLWISGKRASFIAQDCPHLFSQICRFCWHHIKENLNKRCPACRRVYTDDAVEFKPIATQE